MAKRLFDFVVALAGLIALGSVMAPRRWRSSPIRRDRLLRGQADRPGRRSLRHV